MISGSVTSGSVASGSVISGSVISGSVISGSTISGSVVDSSASAGRAWAATSLGEGTGLAGVSADWLRLRPRRPRRGSSSLRFGSTGSSCTDQAAAVTVLAGLAERLEQAGADPLARHLHQAQRGDLGDLVAGAVTAQALDQPAQHQVAVGLQDHVDEVDDDDAADVAQPELADDLLGGLEVVLGDGLLEVAARSR